MPAADPLAHLLAILWLRALALAGTPSDLEVPLDDLGELAAGVRPRAEA